MKRISLKSEKNKSQTGTNDQVKKILLKEYNNYKGKINK